MALGGTSYLYDKLYGRQQVASLSHKPVDTNGDELLVGKRYWIISGTDRDTYIYDNPVDIENYLQEFTHADYHGYREAVLTLYSYFGDLVGVYRYFGLGRFKEEF